MSRSFVNKLTDGQSIDEVYLASEKQLRPNRQGNLYLQIRISDKTGSLTAMMWNANQQHFDAFENGDFVQIRGTAQLYNGKMQMIVTEVKPVSGDSINETDFITLSETSVSKLAEQLAEILGQIRNVHLRRLADQYLADDEFMRNFKRAPAGIKNHHAYHGGLIDHVVSLLQLAQFVASQYDRLDGDLLMMGTFLHDSGKIRELTYERDLSYRDDGQMIGHMVMGVEILQEKISELNATGGDPFPEEMAMQLKHMILSHHGHLEFGSPVLPMSLEAVALHHIDNLDAKMHSIAQIIDEDANPASPWTTYQPSIGRKIYKGTAH